MKVGESEGKLLENCGKIQKQEKGREKRGKIGERMGKIGEAEEKGGKERTREKGRLGSPECRRPVARYRKRRWNFACHVPSTFARKATMFEPPLKKQKMREKSQKKRKFEQSAHWFVTTNRPKWHFHTPRRPQMLITVLTSAKMPQKHGKNDSLLSKIEQKRVFFRKVSGSKN